MARRNERLSHILILAPWWVSLVLAALSYVALKYVVPGLHSDQPVVRGVMMQAPHYAKFASGLFLFFAVLSFIRSLSNARLLDKQRDLDSITGLHWKEFENLVAEYYRRKGFQVKESLAGGADGGIDLSLRKDGKTTIVQCKRCNRKPVPVQVIRELYGVMTAERANTGVLMTTTNFTAEAARFAEGKGIELVGGGELLRCIRSVQSSSSSRSKEKSEVEVSIESSPTCPSCGQAMVKRTARRGKSAGGEFWGCASYPECRGTRNV